MIRKCINWATNQELWPLLWRAKPTQFWYLYPSKEVATIEFETKWVPEFLPRGEFKFDPEYGWKETYKDRYIQAIKFNSGVPVYFKTYEQDVQNLQTGTVYAIFADEELPEHLFPELQARISAASVDGYYHAAFTATLGQDIWRRTLEPETKEEEFLPGAFKRQISLYDCLKYEDGSDSPWTLEKIEKRKAECGTDAEVQRRIYGKFVLSSGRKYPSFSVKNNMSPSHPLPKGWLTYSGVDIGSGGENHPAAIVFVAVNSEFTKGRVFRAWRGDGIVTDAKDILAKHTELKTFPVEPGKAPKFFTMMQQTYDWAAKDFHTISSRAGESFVKADKDREKGQQILNTLFKNKMLSIQEGDPELQKLVTELTSLLERTPKTQAKDDLIDALRYAVSSIPWDWTAATGDLFEKPEEKLDARTELERNIDERRKAFEDEEDKPLSVEEELDEYSEFLENY